MNKSPFFYVLYPDNEKEKNLLNALKVVADPSQRTEAHITIRGPYFNNKLPKSTLKRYSEIIKGEEIEITGVENFFAYGQNTVYFNCAHNNKLEKIWKKFTYNDFKPHITVYDGNDNEFAIEIFRVLSKDFFPFTYKVNNVDYLEPKTDDGLGLYRLLNQFNFSTLKETIGYELNKEEIKKISKLKRLEFIKQLSGLLYFEFKKETTANNSYKA